MAGGPLKKAMDPSTAGPQMNLKVRTGRLRVPLPIKRFSTRADSKMVTQPLPLSLAPGR